MEYFPQDINGNLESVDSIIKATVCLHNYAKMDEIHKASSVRKYCSQSFVDYDLNGAIQSGEWRNISNEGNALCPLATLARRFGTWKATRNGFVNRDIMMDYMNTVGTKGGK